jgi:hypothetical protein
MLAWSLVFLGIAAVIDLNGLSGVADSNWITVRTTLYILLFLPGLALFTVALRRSFAPDSMIAFRTVMFLVMAATFLAFLF